MSRFSIQATPLIGLKLVQRRQDGDSRGWFERLYCSEELAAAAGQPFVPLQINRSNTTSSGAVRGLHFQFPPHAEIKFVSCLRGAVFDVAIDLRAGSSTFLQWHGVCLSAENQASLLIPHGFAHGFQTLCEDCELLYLHSAAHAPEAEGGVHPLEPRAAIVWPLPITGMSARDAARHQLAPAFSGIDLAAYNLPAAITVR